jgi:hypothetical protein
MRCQLNARWRYPARFLRWAVRMLLTTCVAVESAHCGSDRQREPSVQIDTVQGIVMVRNSERGLWTQTHAWHVREEFRIGSADGGPEETFTGGMTGVNRASSGRIGVLDPTVNEIKIYEGSGSYVRTIGGSGGGPSKLSAPSAMAWDPAGQLWVANAFNGRYTVFDTSGNVVKTVPRPVHGQARFQAQLIFRSSSELLDEAVGPAGKVFLLKVDTLGSVVDTLLTIAQPDRPLFRIPPGFDRTAVQYLPLLVWRIAPDGTVWMAESGQLRLIQTTITGDTIRIVETRHRERSLDGALREHLEREFRKVDVDLGRYRLVWPLVQSINVLDDGTVLVQIADEPGVPGHLLDVFDRDGRYLGPLDLGFRMTLRGAAATAGDTLLAVALGESDVPYVVRMTIERTGPGSP